MSTLVERGGAGDDLCTALGLPEQPVIEWRSYTPGHYEAPDEPPPPPELDPTYGTWRTEAPFPVSRTFAITGVIDGVIYVAGGGSKTAFDAPWFATLYAYDTKAASPTWVLKAPLPQPVGSATGGGALDGKLYVAGGVGATGAPLKTLYVYDPATDTWARKADMPAEGGALSASSTVLGGKVYAMRGSSGTGFYAYDPATDTWATKASIPGSVSYRPSGVCNGRLYVVGGSNLYEYNPTTNTWATKVGAPGGSSQAGVVGVGARLYVLGGLNGSGADQDTMRVWHQDTNTWETYAPGKLPALWRLGVAAKVGSRLYIAAGANDATTSYSIKVPDDELAGPPAPPDPEPVWVPAGWTVDPVRTAALAHYTVTYGRQNPTGSTEPLQVSTALVRELAGLTLPTLGERFRLTVADPIAAALGLAEADRPRFTGEVTDVDVDTEGLVALAGVGLAARLGRVPVGGTRWPTESTGNRVARILAAADQRLDLDLGTLDPGGPLLLARPAGAQPAGQQLEQLSVATTGQLVEQRTGQLEWHNETHRRNPGSRLTLTATELLKPFRWTQRVGSVVNDARVTYGDPQATAAVTDPNSADPATGVGAYPVAITTELADQADAYALGSVIVGRRAAPTWELPLVTVDLVRSAPLSKIGPLLGLRHGHLVTTTGLPPIGPYTVSDVFVEGATETFTRTGWQLSLAVADKALAGVALRWIDVPDAEIWDTVTPTLTWLGAATAGTTDL